MTEHAYYVGEEVAVDLPGLSRSLYGRVVRLPERSKIGVRVWHGDEQATLSVDVEAVRPWREK